MQKHHAMYWNNKGTLSMRSFHPHVTVATIVEKENKFLIVEELDQSDIVFNQPAGHLESDESLIQAAERETLEETGWRVKAVALLGIDLFTSPKNKETYFRTTFIADAVKFHSERALDTGIIQAHWLTLEEIQQRKNQLRSPLVLDTIRRYQSGHRHSLTLLGEP